MSTVNIGDRLPIFQGQDQDGKIITDSDLRGKCAVVYFYPKDNTPGCTKEACNFRDQMEQLTALNATVIGISPDGAHSHRSFIEKQQLNFSLLADEQRQLCHAFDVLRGDKVERSTFVVDSDGRISWIERPVSVDGHVDRVIAALQALS
jgi:peroxiredoxin Q/BCP